MAWKQNNNSGNNNFNGGQDQIENWVVQSALAKQLAPIMEEIRSTGNLTDSREKAHLVSAKRMIIGAIFYCARQCDNKIFTDEEVKKFWDMTAEQLMGELSFYEGEAGMLLSKTPPTTSKFESMIKYWEVVRKNRQNYILNNPEMKKKYKIIIIPADQATKDELADAEEKILEELEPKTAENGVL